MNTATRKRLFVAFKKAGIDGEQRHDVIEGWTNGRTDSTTDITENEAIAMIQRLTAPKPKSYTPDKADQIRKRLIAMSYSINEDVDFVKGWCEKYGISQNGEIVRKSFNDYTAQELMGLCEKFKKVIHDRMAAVTGIK